MYLFLDPRVVIKLKIEMIAEIYKIFKENNYATFGVCIYLFLLL